MDGALRGGTDAVCAACAADTDEEFGEFSGDFGGAIPELDAGPLWEAAGRTGHFPDIAELYESFENGFFR
jgi:hypothetical protein